MPPEHILWITRKRTIQRDKHFFEPTRKIKNEEILNLNGMNVVRMKWGERILVFLLYRGASISVIFKEFLPKEQTFNKGRNTKIKGVNGSIFSQGTANLELRVNNENIRHEFLVIDKFENDILGVIGSDLLQKYKAIIDYEKFNLSLSVHEIRLILPVESKFNFYTTIPERCEVIRYFKVNVNEDCVILPTELCEGVFVAGAIVRPNWNKIPVKILNVSI